MTFHGSAVAFHNVADMAIAKTGHEPNFQIAAPGCIEQKPADECQPQSAEIRTHKEPKQPKQNEQEGYSLADLGGRSSRPFCIAIDPPDDCPQDTSAIERVSGNHIEAGENDVNVSQPEQHGESGRCRFSTR